MSQFRYIPLRDLMELRSKILNAKWNLDHMADKSGLVESLFGSFIGPIVSIYQPIISSLASHHSDDLYRARKCIAGKPFSDIKDLYNPPTPSGRAFTKENVPILYASSSMQTCLSEINVKIGDLVCVVAFKYSAIKNGRFWFVGQLGSFHKSYEESRYLGDVNAVQRLYYNESEVVHSRVFTDLLINEIFSTISSDVDKYALNRLLIDAIRDKSPEKQIFYGVVFISEKDAPGTNFAIYGEAITKLEPMIVNLIRITDVDDYGCIGYKLLENAKPNKSMFNKWLGG